VPAEGARETIPLVVCGQAGRQVGLVVERILDVIEAQAVLEPSTRGDGTLGSAVLDRHVTDLLDVPSLIRAAYPAEPAPTRS
jgi:two-component system chemotaxis sensor kinase CheA